MSQPKNLFLMDGLGALLSALCLMAMSGPLQVYVGMPQHVLTALAIAAALMCIYSLSCSVAVKKRWKPFLRTVAIINLLYSLATIAGMIRHWPMLKIPGIIYFILEILTLIVLVYVELSAVNHLHQRSQTADLDNGD